jgi:hypothetical protein
MCSWRTTPAAVPAPSKSAVNEELSAGTACSARTTAHPMMWVKLTLPPVVRPS